MLLDVEMPGISGFEVLAALRADAIRRPSCPVIMVTARTDGADIVEAFRLGANDYVTKPIDFPVALARIGTHLSHKRAVEDLHESEERYALAMQGANDGLWDWNLVDQRGATGRRAGRRCSATRTRKSARAPMNGSRACIATIVERVREALTAHLAGGRGHYESEHRMLHRNGTFRWVLCRGAAIRNGDGDATRLAGSLTDITDAKVADALTGLPNRLLFVDLLDRAIKRHGAAAATTCSRCSCSASIGSRMVGDSLGPLTADRLLVAVAQRLQSSLRAHRRRHAGTRRAHAGAAGRRRVHGARSTTSPRRATRSASRSGCGGRCEKPFDIDGHADVHVGDGRHRGQHDRLPRAGRDPARCRRPRSIAPRRTARRAASSSIRRCATRAVSRLQLETDLRRGHRATARSSCTTSRSSRSRPGAIAGFEALVRWRHPTRGLVSPARVHRRRGRHRA